MARELFCGNRVIVYNFRIQLDYENGSSWRPPQSLWRIHGSVWNSSSLRCETMARWWIRVEENMMNQTKINCLFMGERELLNGLKSRTQQTNKVITQFDYCCSECWSLVYITWKASLLREGNQFQINVMIISSVQRWSGTLDAFHCCGGWPGPAGKLEFSTR